MRPLTVLGHCRYGGGYGKDEKTGLHWSYLGKPMTLITDSDNVTVHQFYENHTKVILGSQRSQLWILLAARVAIRVGCYDQKHFWLCSDFPAAAHVHMLPKLGNCLTLLQVDDRDGSPYPLPGARIKFFMWGAPDVETCARRHSMSPDGVYSQSFCQAVGHTGTLCPSSSGPHS